MQVPPLDTVAQSALYQQAGRAVFWLVGVLVMGALAHFWAVNKFVIAKHAQRVEDAFKKHTEDLREDLKALQGEVSNMGDKLVGALQGQAAHAAQVDALHRDVSELRADHRELSQRVNRIAEARN